MLCTFKVNALSHHKGIHLFGINNILRVKSDINSKFFRFALRKGGEKSLTYCKKVDSSCITSYLCDVS